MSKTLKSKNIPDPINGRYVGDTADKISSVLGVNQCSIEKYRKVLGTIAKDMSDDEIRRCIFQVDVLTDIVVTHFQDSIIHSSIDIIEDEEHTYV